MAIDRNKILQNAEKLVRQSKVDQALELYEQLISDSPRDLNLKNKVGDLYARAGNTADAVRVFNQVAGGYAEDGFYLKAIAIYKKVNKIDPASIDCYYRLADLYAKQGLNNDAKSQLQQVAEMYAKEGNTAKVVEAMERWVKLDPENVQVRNKLAEHYVKLGQTKRAVAEYELVGAELVKKSMLEEAIRVFERGVALDDANVSLVGNLAKAMLQLGRNQDLIERARSLSQHSQENVELLGALVDAYQRTGQGELARQVLEKLCVVDANNPVWRERLADGKTTARRGEPAGVASGGGRAADGASVPDYMAMSGDYSMEELSGEWGRPGGLGGEPGPSVEEAAAGHPASGADSERAEFIAEHMTEAEVFIKYGLIEKAIDNLEAIVSHYPDEVETLRRLKDLHLEAGNRARAAEKCVELARIARESGDMQKALDLIGEARAHDPTVKLERPVRSEPSDSAEGSLDYGFGDEPVALDSGTPSSGVELEFDGPSVRATTHAEIPTSGVSLDFGDEPGGDGSVDFNVDHDAGEPAGVEIDLDSGSGEPTEGDLAEIDFYSEGGFVEEARGRLEAMRARYPSSRKLRERLERLPRKASGEVVGASIDEGIEFFDNAIRARRGPGSSVTEDTDRSLFEQEAAFLTVGADAVPAKVGQSSDDSLDVALGGIRLESQVEAEDYRTHYDLGIAYREMGLVDEAVAEFQLASKDATKFVDCCINLGLCFCEKGLPKLAVRWYLKALDSVGESSPQYVAIAYDLAVAYELSGDKEQALEFYVNVYGLDSNYRDIAEKMSKLE